VHSLSTLLINVKTLQKKFQIFLFFFKKILLLMFLDLLFSQNGKFFATIKNAGLLTKNFHLDLGEV
jgi:hypothetical protein